MTIELGAQENFIDLAHGGSGQRGNELVIPRDFVAAEMLTAKGNEMLTVLTGVEVALSIGF